MWTSVAFFSVLLLECLAFEEKDMICSDDFCAKYVETKGCPELSEACLAQNETHNGVFLPYPDVCNCCKYCVTNLGLGEVCAMGSPGLSPPSSICGPGLACKALQNQQSTCQRIDTSCTRKQDDWDTRREMGTLGLTEVRPQCDGDGLFLPVHCIPGSLCYCLSSEGERIFGELPFLDHSDEHKMTCGCSLNHQKALESVNAQFKSTFLSARCNEYGLYDPLQCMTDEEAKCYCVNPISGDPRPEVPGVPIGELRPGNPSCFDAKIHALGTYESECEAEQKKWHESLPKIAKSDPKLSPKEIGFENPKCQPDGKYHRVQIRGSSRICVDPSGNQIDTFEAMVGSDTAKSMDCNCARALYLLRKVNVTELPSCDVVGSFEPLQCHRGQCYCVDCNGNQIGLEKNNAEELSCATSCVTN